MHDLIKGLTAAIERGRVVPTALGALLGFSLCLAIAFVCLWFDLQFITFLFMCPGPIVFAIGAAMMFAAMYPRQPRGPGSDQPTP